MVLINFTQENKDSSLLSVGGTINFKIPINFPTIARQRGGGDIRNYKIHVVNASINAAIPNIYNTADYANNSFDIQLRDSSNVNAPIIQNVILPNGVYDARLITRAITNVINQLNWSNDAELSPIRFEVLIAQQRLLLQFDHSLVNTTTFAGYDQFALDLTAFPNFASLMGFNAELYVSQTLAPFNSELDLFGNNILISADGFGDLSYRNEKTTSILCRIPIAERRGNQYFIEGTSEPWIDCEPARELRSLSVRVNGDRDHPQKSRIYLLDGQFSLTVEILPT